jgi:hypothetical protein
MQFIVAFAKKLPWVSIGLFVGGFVLGLIWAYILAPTKFINATPSYLRADLQQDYLRMAIDSNQRNRNPSVAAEHWACLGAGALPAFGEIQKDPRGLDLQTFQNDVNQVPAGTLIWCPPESGSSTVRNIVLLVGLVVLLGVLGYGGLYAYRLLNKRGSGVVTPTMQAVEMSRKAEKTDFEKQGLAPPITQTMTTYVLGDDLYDESFGINSQAGEFMGEYGVGVSGDIGVGAPKKVTAFEIWLFDKNDIKTATKVLMSEHAYNDPTIRARLEPKGELVQIQPQSQVLLETATLQLLATVVDLEYGHGPLPNNSYFERITLELAIWPRQS